jgi:2-polyprenyl-6-methoxyphenol hydroxylase-like FAD-dependent oxidoreductase
MAEDNWETTCCVVGGGPAGIMLGFLLARSGVRVTVLEKHGDFLQDFRGDTVHPSTLDLFHQLGLLEDFLKLPHQELPSIGAAFGDFSFRAADFSRVPGRAKFIALMPQWDLLDFLVKRARQFPTFDLRMQHEGVTVIADGSRITGVEARKPDGTTQRIQANLVVACDGRHSTVRQAAQMEVREFGVPIDVLWFHISRQPGDPERALGNFNYGKALILINRGTYYQAGLIIRKGSFDEVKSRGMGEFRQAVSQVAPYLADRASELHDWEQIKLLTVKINRLRQWYRPGLLCIGDAAHAMSPAWGVGINLAIQDATAAARILANPLLQNQVTGEVLAAVQHRREFPTQVTQFLQVNVHRAMERFLFQNPGPFQAPWPLKLAMSIPGVSHLTGRFVGLGVRPEQIRHSPRERKVPAWTVCAAICAAFAVTAVRLVKNTGRKTMPAAKLPALRA